MNNSNMKADSHFVSLIIPSLGRESLEITKKAITSQTRPPDELIIVFDEFRRGPGWARNQGFMKAKGDLIAFTDDDCVPGEAWLEELIAAIDNYDAAMVSSHYNETDPLLDEIRRRRKFPQTTQINPVGFVGIGGNVIFQRKCLEECLATDGFVFNEVFGTYGSEDCELAARLKRRGCKLVYVDNRITHLKRVSAIKYMWLQFFRGVGIGIFHRLHKKSGSTEIPGKSLLWQDDSSRMAVKKWMHLLNQKILGPFDIDNFSSTRNFSLYWLGEKFMSMGFLYAMLFKRI